MVPKEKTNFQTLLVELEDANLHQLRNRQVLQPSVLHARKEIGSDVKDADLNQFIDGRLISESSNFADFGGVYSLDFQSDQLVGVGQGITKRRDALCIGGIEKMRRAIRLSIVMHLIPAC